MLRNVLDMGNMEQQNNINVQVTEDDSVVCTCGSEFFVPAMRIAKKKSPIIGQAPMMIPVGQDIICYMCNTKVGPESKTKGELKNTIITE